MANRSKHRSRRPQAERGASGVADSIEVDPAAPPEPRRDAFPVVGIGASAGGLEAFTRLVKALPGDTGMAFVFVQHLDPKHPSHLCELLSRSSAMPVVQAADGMPVEPDCVHVMPENADMEIDQGVLRP